LADFLSSLNYSILGDFATFPSHEQTASLEEDDDLIRRARRGMPGQMPRQVNPEILQRHRQTTYRMRSAAERSLGVGTRDPNL
jgi:hypothetical protein